MNSNKRNFIITDSIICPDMFVSTCRGATPLNILYSSLGCNILNSSSVCTNLKSSIGCTTLNCSTVCTHANHRIKVSGDDLESANWLEGKKIKECREMIMARPKLVKDDNG